MGKQQQIPKPSGPHAVGCFDVMTTPDASGVFFRLFYPSPVIEGAKTAEWLPDKKYLKGYAAYFDLWPGLFTNLYPYFIGEIDVPATWNTPPLSNGTQFPVIVFSHGVAACRTTYTTICLELASHGYVVAAIEHRDYSASASFFLEEVPQKDEKDKPRQSHEQCQSSSKIPELKKKFIVMKKIKADEVEHHIRKQQLQVRVKETCMVLNWLQRLNDGGDVINILETSFPLKQFQDLLDLSRAIVGGHSFGGATAVAAMAQDKRFRVGFGLDPWMLPLGEEAFPFSSDTQRMLFVNMETFQTQDDLRVQRKLESLNASRLRIITLKGTVHLNQTDVPFICPGILRWFFRARSRTDRFLAMDLTTRSTLNFLSKHLDFPMQTNYCNYLEQYPEVVKEGILPLS